MRRALAVSVGISVSVSAPALRAESGSLCVPAQIVEIFAGTAACPGAAYLVLETKGYGFIVNPTFAEDHCGGSLGAFSNYQEISIASPDTRLLVARPEAEALFGIQADVPAVGHIPTLDGRLDYSCQGSSEVAYGTYSTNVPKLQPGMALKWNGSSWTLGSPTPTNRQGVMGTLGNCPTDASTDPAVDAALEAAPLPPCEEPDAAGQGGFAGTAGGGPARPIDASTEGGGASAAGSAEAGSQPSGSQARSDTQADAGCGCRTRTPRHASVPWLLAALGALCLRRIRSRS